MQRVSLMARISGLPIDDQCGRSDIRTRFRLRPDGSAMRAAAARGRHPRIAPLMVDSFTEFGRAGEFAGVTRSQPLLWTTRSLRNLVEALAAKGHKICPMVVERLLHGMGYSLQANSKTRECSKHDRSRRAIVQYINTQAKAFLAAHDRSYRSIRKRRNWLAISRTMAGMAVQKGRHELVNVHDFMIRSSSRRRAVPASTIITNNVGCVSVGTDRSTPPALPSDAIRRWWRAMGIRNGIPKPRGS